MKLSKFKLEKARRHGEQIAKDYGFEAFPIDPFAIAESENILVEPKPPDRPGVSGGIVFHDESVGIFYATNIKSAGFQRFTVAHELGHYFLEGHPEEIRKLAPVHISRAGFTEGDSSIELEADHFASGLLMPSHLVRETLSGSVVGLTGIEELADRAECSLTAAAIRAAECSRYPMAIVVSSDAQVSYCFMSDSFKNLRIAGRLNFPRRGDYLPPSATLEFNRNPENVELAQRKCAETTLAEWFDGSSGIKLDEEIRGLGSYGLTLTVFSSDAMPEDPAEYEDEEAALIESYIPRFAYGR